ncbi:hypothetical protein EGW08_011899 [Elysia chlorotica]|uniref:Cerebral cavernous malformations 2 harmonin-homology domain-containing protein n=1 Tax=Elysia chlorotica TaxID=188477 RepID=A0A433TFJ2_ELYCH|nr:hypothetical protein EGW08_011899 [Elysia chlorotica]
MSAKDEPRHKLKLFSRRSLPSPAQNEKPRALNRYELKSPMYPNKPHNLIDGHVSETVQFVGEIEGVSPDLDITNRTDVLRIIDKGKKKGVIPVHVEAHEKIAILSLSVFNIKISSHINHETLLRIPMHEIAAICYIKDDQQHILAVKFGSVESCRLALLYCENKLLAEQICALVGQCFNLVYTEATVYLIERQLSPPERAGSVSSGTASTLVQNRHPDLSSYYSASVANYPRVPSDSESLRNSDSGAGKELLEDYMTKLTSKLTPEELRRFLLHLDDWKKENHFPEFCDDVLAMLGQERKQLLSELLPFIPAENFQYFEDFLRRNDIRLLENSSTFSGSQTNLRRRSLSEVSTTSSVSNTAASGEALDHLQDYSNDLYNSVDVEMGGKTLDVPIDY